jgi:hypothetical protein
MHGGLLKPDTRSLPRSILDSKHLGTIRFRLQPPLGSAQPDMRLFRRLLEERLYDIIFHNRYMCCIYNTYSIDYAITREHYPFSWVQGWKKRFRAGGSMRMTPQFPRTHKKDA